jgi:hypothetical protein
MQDELCSLEEAEEFSKNRGYTYKIYEPPKVIGWWILPGSFGGHAIKLACYTKPRWITIKMMKLILEFGYEHNTKTTG